MQEEERRRAAAEDAAAQHARDADLERRHVAAIIAAHLPAKPTAASVAADGQRRALEEEKSELSRKVGTVEARASKAEQEVLLGFLIECVFACLVCV